MERIRDQFTSISNMPCLSSPPAARSAALSMVQAAKRVFRRKRTPCPGLFRGEGIAMMAASSVFSARCDEAAAQQFGALPWRKGPRGRLQVLLITSRRRGRWILPKGWPLADREPCLVAAMEAFEEAGVIGEIEPNPIGRYDYLKEGGDGAVQRVCVTLFGLSVVGTLTNWPERGQRKRRWFGLAEAAETVADHSLIPLIRAIRDTPQILFDKAEPGTVPSAHSGSLVAQ